MFEKIITRRELLLLGKRFLFLIAGWKFLSCPSQVFSREKIHSQLTDIIGYLLYENNPPSHLRAEIGKQVYEFINSTIGAQLEQEIFLRTNVKNFKDLPPEDKKIFVKTILPELIKHPEIMDIINNYLQGNRLQQYLDYPDLPGEFGECGWLVLEGDIWDRYYPPSG